MIQPKDCCGLGHISIFCPTCGRRLRDNATPAESLLTHLRITVQTLRSRYNGILAMKPDGRIGIRDYEGDERELAMKADKTLKKWESWLTFVESVMPDEETK